MKKRKKKVDKFFSKKSMKIEDFKFTKKVASVFDNMVSRSVPFYNESQEYGIEIATRFIQNGSKIYDLGCSTGTNLINLDKKLENLKIKKCKYVGIDSSQPMIDVFNKKIKKNKNKNNFKLIAGDMKDQAFEKNISVFFMSYTLQFIRPLDRENLIKKIYKSLKNSGCIILLEKILVNDSYLNRSYIDIYYDYKIKQGYSNVEIQKKREALENVLIPYRQSENFQMLRRSGFKKIDTFFQWFNWMGFIAIK